jgi:Predicted membrane-associated Zn-dependent proteases 1
LQISTQIFIFIFFIYWLLIIYLKRTGVLAKYNISAFGPILTIETKKGLKYLDTIALPKRFWRLFANIGIVLMFTGMILMFLMILVSDYLLIQNILGGVVTQPSDINKIQNVFLIPGVNQFIPFVWGVLALIIAVFIHEMMHSVLARAEDIKVHAVGLLVALFPIGGFAKIDDKQLYGDEFEGLNEIDAGTSFDEMTATIEEIRAHEKKMQEEITRNMEAKSDSKNKSTERAKVATKTQRSRILAAGVMSNFCVALIAASLFFFVVLGGIQPIGNLQITGMDDASPSALSGLTKEMVLTEINGQKVTDAASVNQALASVTPGDSVTISASHNRVTQNYTVLTDPSAETVNYAGILIAKVTSGSPAETAGIRTGMIVYQMDGVYILDAEDFSSKMKLKSPGETVVFSAKTVDENGRIIKTEEIEVVLGASKTNESDAYVGINLSSGPLYIGLLDLSVGVFNASAYLDVLKSLPALMTDFDLSDIKGSLSTMLLAWITVLMMPFLSVMGEGFGGFSGVLLQFFEPAGWAEPLGIGIFWAANFLFWTAWVNFNVGLFNCLPALPLDGGHLFRTWFVKIAEKLKMEEKKAVRLSFRVTGWLSAFIFLSFFAMFIWPYISSFVIGLIR